MAAGQKECSMTLFKISGYTTCRNCIEMDYPFEEAIQSMLTFCDEVVVVDSSDKDDGTMAKLEELMDEFEHLFVYHVDVPWDAPNYGIYDGQTKALARSKCTGDYLWQQDVDEIAEEGMREKLEKLLEQAAPFMDQAPVICLPVVEYWGGFDKVRVDVNPWKWRLSRTLENITHGIPLEFRLTDDSGNLYARPGTDGCDYIDADPHHVIPHASFYTGDIHALRVQALPGVDDALPSYSVSKDIP